MTSPFSALHRWLLASPAFCLLALSLNAAAAEEISYTNLSVGYDNVDLRGEDFRGLRIAGSFRVTDGAYVFGSTTELDSDDAIAGAERDVSVNRIGGGTIFPINDLMHATAAAAFVNQDGAEQAGIVEGDGVAVTAGLRALTSNGNVELGGNLGHLRLEENRQTEFSLFARYYLLPAISAGVALELADNDAFLLDLRVEL